MQSSLSIKIESNVKIIIRDIIMKTYFSLLMIFFTSSLIEYFVEAESVYKNLQARMQLENQYQKVMADIYKNEL